MFGDPIVPAERMTSPPAFNVTSCSLFLTLNRTPLTTFCSPFSNNKFVVIAFVFMSRFDLLIIGLRKGDSNISLEPGGQFELSGGIKKSVHGVEKELKSLIKEPVYAKKFHPIYNNYPDPMSSLDARKMLKIDNSKVVPTPSLLVKLI